MKKQCGRKQNLSLFPPPFPLPSLISGPTPKTVPVGPSFFARRESASLLVFVPEQGLIVPVKLDLLQKQTLYHELGQFLRSGIPLSQAVEALAQDTRRGPLRRVLEQLTRLFLGGQSVPAAFAQLQPAVGSLELAMVEAASSSGRLEQAFAYLSNYFGSLEAIRGLIIRQSAWPLVQLHLGVVVINASTQLVNTHTLDAALLGRQCGLAFGILYAWRSCSGWEGHGCSRPPGRAPAWTGCSTSCRSSDGCGATWP